MPSGDLSEFQSAHGSRKRHHGQKRASRSTSLITQVTPTKLIDHNGIPSSHTTSSSGTADEVMAMFQQFCASCEKQMTVMNPSILYCSDRCRRQDSTHSQSFPLFKTDISLPPTSYPAPSFEDNQPKDIVPQMSPTIRTKSSFTYFPYQESVGYLPQSTSEIVAASPPNGRPSIQRRDSEAARFLATFNSEDPERPYYSRRGSGTAAEPGLSASLTPASSASIVSPYTPSGSPVTSRRPERPRTNPRWSSISFSNRSVDLIMPISHATSFLDISDSNISKENYQAHAPSHSSATKLGGDPEEHLAYAKRVGLDTTSLLATSSLKTLFQFDEMRSDPPVADLSRKGASQSYRITNSTNNRT